MKFAHNFTFYDIFDSQGELLLVALMITTIILFGLLFLLLRNFLSWYLKIDEINKNISFLNVNINKLSSKLNNFQNFNYSKKIVPQSSVKIAPIMLNDKDISNSKSKTLDQNKKRFKSSNLTNANNPVKDYDDDLLADAIESNRSL